MTHRGPFQPLPFCDSVTSEHQRSPSVPLTCSLWLADHRKNNSLGVLCHTSTEAKGPASTESYCQNIVLFYSSTHLGISGLIFSNVFCLYITAVSLLILPCLNPISTWYYSTIILSLPLLLLVSHYSCFTSIPIFAFSKVFPSPSSFAFAPDPVSHHSPFQSWSTHTFFFFSTPSSAPFSAQFREYVCCSPL